MTLKLGDRVRIDIPDELDPDFNLHDEHAIVLDNDNSRRAASRNSMLVGSGNNSTSLTR